MTPLEQPLSLTAGSGTWGERIPEPDWHLYTQAGLTEFWREQVPAGETVTADRARELWAAEKDRKVARLEEIKAVLMNARQRRLDTGRGRLTATEAGLAAELAQQAAADDLTVTDPVLAEEIREAAWEYARAEGQWPGWYDPEPDEGWPDFDRNPAQEETIRIGSPPGLLAVVPVLLGFEPGDRTLVVIGSGPESDSAVRMTMRYDLPDDRRLALRLAREAAAALSGNGLSRAVAVAYGPVELTEPFTSALRTELPQADITVGAILRAENGRYWSLLHAGLEGPAPEGTPFDTARRTPLASAPPVLASRAELAATVAAVTGDDAKSMRGAIHRAALRLGRLGGGDPETRRRALIDTGLKSVSDAIALYRGGGQFASHDEAAQLAVALQELRIRDDAWSRMIPEHKQAHLRLWADLTQLAPGRYVTAPASLLAFTAWQSGNGALANVALDRALAANPRYSMAVLLLDAINSGEPPSRARLPMTPEQVAESYDRAENLDRVSGTDAVHAERQPAPGLAAEVPGSREDVPQAAAGAQQPRQQGDGEPAAAPGLVSAAFPAEPGSGLAGGSRPGTAHRHQEAKARPGRRTP